MNNFYEELKQYLETTPREEVLKTWEKYNTPENNVGVTMDDFLENCVPKLISPLEVLTMMRDKYRDKCKYITRDWDMNGDECIIIWQDKPTKCEGRSIYTVQEGDMLHITKEMIDYKVIDWKDKTLYSLEEE